MSLHAGWIFLFFDYVVGNISKAFHCYLWAQWLLEMKRKGVKFHGGRWIGWGGDISARAEPPEAQPFSKPATEQVWKHLCNATLMSHPISTNSPRFNWLLSCPSVTKNTWKLRKKYYSNLQMQHFVYSPFPKHRHSQREISLQSPSLFILHAFFPEAPLSVSATVLEPCDSLLFLFERNPTHTEHGCHLAPYQVLKKDIEQIINRGEQEETELL